MAPSKSWSSEPLAAPRRRYFTVSEANRALPLVSRIVADIVKTHERATLLHGQLEGRMKSAERHTIEQDLERAVDRLGDLIGELKDVGCELKDYRPGLIDFVGKHQGREIYLCWKLHEPAVEHWHELNEGFAGRQPIQLLES
ncbi:MAG: DUF2203 domain-containing protein [Tepidisphaeraceae bacterium]